MNLVINTNGGELSATMSGTFTFDDNKRFADILDKVDNDPVTSVADTHHFYPRRVENWGKLYQLVH